MFAVVNREELLVFQNEFFQLRLDARGNRWFVRNECLDDDGEVLAIFDVIEADCVSEDFGIDSAKAVDEIDGKTWSKSPRDLVGGNSMPIGKSGRGGHQTFERTIVRNFSDE